MTPADRDDDCTLLGYPHSTTLIIDTINRMRRITGQEGGGCRMRLTRINRVGVIPASDGGLLFTVFSGTTGGSS